MKLLCLCASGWVMWVTLSMSCRISAKSRVRFHTIPSFLFLPTYTDLISVCSVQTKWLRITHSPLPSTRTHHLIEVPALMSSEIRILRTHWSSSGVWGMGLTRYHTSEPWLSIWKAQVKSLIILCLSCGCEAPLLDLGPPASATTLTILPLW